MRRTLNALNLTTADLERAVNRELKQAGSGTLIIRNIDSAVSAEKIASMAMHKGWDVGCKKKGKHFLVTLSKGTL